MNLIAAAGWHTFLLKCLVCVVNSVSLWQECYQVEDELLTLEVETTQRPECQDGAVDIFRAGWHRLQGDGIHRHVLGHP